MSYDAEQSFAVAAVTEACRLGRRVQDEIVAAGDARQKDDRSPVTVADLAIQAVISHRLRDAFPDDPLLAEEDAGVLEGDPALAERVADVVRRAVPELDQASMARALDRGDHGGEARRYWVLDPVDGTKGFLRGEQYAVAFAMVEDGRVVVGALGCPNLVVDPERPDRGAGCVFAAVRGAGTTMVPVDGGEPRPVTVDGIASPTGARFCESVEAAHAAHSDQAQIAARLGITAPSYRIDSQCKYAVVARGEASIYLRLPSKKGYREKTWDHAAGSIVIEEAGGRVSDLDGNPLDFSEGRLLANPSGIVATNGTLHDAVLAACRAVLGLD